MGEAGRTKGEGASGWWRATAFVVACGCVISLVSYGLRTSFGLFAGPISEGNDWSLEVFALAIAIQNVVWGVAQPFAGAIADRYGSARILAGGGVLYVAGVALMAVSDTPLAFNLTAGVLVGLGLAGGSFTIVIAALGRLVPEEKRSWAMGLATAAGSLGQFAFAPLGQAFLSSYGWQTALLLLAGFAVAVPLLAGALRGGGGYGASEGSRYRGLRNVAAHAGRGPLLRRGHGRTMALDCTPYLGARCGHVRNPLPRHPLRLRVLLPPGRGFPWGLARRGRLRADRRVPARVVGGCRAGDHSRWPPLAD